jgi:hypothetical protein
LRSDVQGLLDAHYPAVAADLLIPLLDLIQTSRRACVGDLDKFLVLLVVAVRTAQHPQFVAMDNAQLEACAFEALPNLGINARSIAESVEIPKETVRRKVAELIEAGWLMRRGNDLHLTGYACQALKPVRDQVLSQATRNFDTAAALVDDAPPAQAGGASS